MATTYRLRRDSAPDLGASMDNLLTSLQPNSPQHSQSSDSIEICDVEAGAVPDTLSSEIGTLSDLPDEEVDALAELSSELSDLPNDEINALRTLFDDLSDQESSDSSPPVTVPTPRSHKAKRKPQVRPHFPGLQRRQEGETKHPEREVYEVRLVKRRQPAQEDELVKRHKGARETFRSKDVSVDKKVSLSQKTPKDWNEPSIDMFADTERYIRHHHGVSLYGFFARMIRSPEAAYWRLMFERSFLSGSVEDNENVLNWADQMVRELQDINYRPIVCQLQEESFSDSRHLYTKLEGNGKRADESGTDMATAASSLPKTLHDSSSLFLTSLTVDTPADTARVETVQRSAPS